MTDKVIEDVDCACGTTHLEAHKDERLEVLLIEQGENLRCRHREEHLFDSGEVEQAE